MSTGVVVAPATPLQRSALALIRLSGEGLDVVLNAVVEPLRPTPLAQSVGRPRRVALRDADGVYDDGVVTLHRGPNSYTGEDTAEVTCHGNPLVVERFVAAAVDAGARVAAPGEFTRRAVLNGKLDLVRAEAVDQITRAASTAGIALSRLAMDGRLGRHYDAVRTRLVEATAELEARLDYPADELAYEDDVSLLETVRAVASDCRALASTYTAGRTRVDGARVALVGAVNAGKSSLFNALLGRRRALVHAQAGTTRDVLEVQTLLHGVPVTLLDTAGERATDDPVEAAGLALARELVDEADLLVVVLRAGPDAPSPSEEAILERTAKRARIVVTNGVDRHAEVDGTLPTCATEGVGIDALATAITRALSPPIAGELLIASARQRDLLLSVASCCDEALEGFELAGVAVSADALTRAIEQIDTLTGADTREDVLDALFARFCIGK